MINVETISKIAYELYTMDWVNRFVSHELQLSTYREYLLYRNECLMNDDECDSFDEWIWDYGYNGFMYACYEEFIDCEYLEAEYIEMLLGDKALIDLYHKDTEE